MTTVESGTRLSDLVCGEVQWEEVVSLPLEVR